MNTVCIFDDKNMVRATGRRKTPSTATYIFDDLYQHVFRVNTAHLKMKFNMGDSPIIHSGQADYERIVDELMPTRGRIIDMVDYFIDGATISLEPSVAAEVYKRISDHLAAHVRALQSSKYYEMPDINDFRQMTEFALAIRTQALVSNPHLEDTQKPLNFIEMHTRPTFSRKSIAAATPKDVVPKPLKQMDFIEKFAEMYL